MIYYSIYSRFPTNTFTSLSPFPCQICERTLLSTSTSSVFFLNDETCSFFRITIIFLCVSHGRKDFHSIFSGTTILSKRLPRLYFLEHYNINLNATSIAILYPLEPCSFFVLSLNPPHFQFSSPFSPCALLLLSPCLRLKTI